MEITILDMIGCGSYGTVYKAQDILGRDLAVKFFEDAEDLDLIKSQAIGMLRVKHKNVVELISLEEKENPRSMKKEPCIIMEYFDGHPISQIKNISIENVVKITEQIINGLNAIHSAGIFHGDIHEDNILFNKNTNEIKIIDMLIYKSIKSLTTINRNIKKEKEINNTKELIKLLLKKSKASDIIIDIFLNKKENNIDDILNNLKESIYNQHKILISMLNTKNETYFFYKDSIKISNKIIFSINETIYQLEIGDEKLSISDEDPFSFNDDDNETYLTDNESTTIKTKEITIPTIEISNVTQQTHSTIESLAGETLDETYDFERDVELLSINPFGITIKISDYKYTGGAHGFRSCVFKTIYPEQPYKEKTYTNITAPPFKIALKTINKIRQNRDYHSDILHEDIDPKTYAYAVEILDNIELNYVYTIIEDQLKSRHVVSHDSSYAGSDGISSDYTRSTYVDFNIEYIQEDTQTEKIPKEIADFVSKRVQNYIGWSVIRTEKALNTLLQHINHLPKIILEETT